MNSTLKITSPRISSNLALVTATSFLSYFTMSAIISPLGIVSASLADHYDISLTSATALFSYLTTGVLIGSLLSILLNPLFGSKKVIIVSAVIIVVAIVLARSIDLASFLPIAFASIGASCGLLLAGGAIVLTATYKERHRPSALLATDSFYSFAGFVTAPFAGFVVASSLHWTSAYAVAGFVCAIIVVLAFFAKYPPELKPPSSETGLQSRWSISAYLVGAALFVYLVCFVFVYSWAPARASAQFGLSATEAGLLVGRFFLGLFIGQVAMFFLALRFNVKLLIAIIGAGATIVSSGLWLSASASQFGVSLFVLGLVAGGLLKPLIAYGTQIVAHPTSRLVGFFMFCTALGSSVSPALGASVVEATNITTVLVAATVGFGMTYALIVISFFASRESSLR